MNDLETCQTYVDHLRAEHRQLHAEVRRIKNVFFAERTKSDRLSEVKLELSALADELRKHFAEEEDGGCLEEAISRCPSVAAEADALQRQHPGLLANLQQVTAALSAPPQAVSLADVEAKFDDFTRQLMTHEAAENKVMQRAFGVTVNGE